MGEGFRIIAIVVTGVLGVCCLAGFLQAFRDRIYLGLLGLSFISLAGAFAVRVPQGAMGLLWLRRGLLGLAGVLFMGAVFFAVAQTMVQMRLIQERRKALEAEMWAYLEELKQRTGQTEDKAGQPPANES